MADPNAMPASVPASVPVAAPVNPASSTQAMVVQLPKGDLDVRVTGTPTDYITPGIQIAVAIFSAAASAGVIIWQMKRQYKQAIEQHHLNVKADLRLEAYREFQSEFRAFNDTGNPAVDILSLQAEFAIAIDQLKTPTPQLPLRQRSPVLMDGLFQYTKGAIRLIYFLERYESLLPGFDIFKMAINCALHDMRAVNIAFQQVLIKWLPVEHPEYGRNAAAPQFLHRPTITEAALNELNSVSPPLEKALNQLQCWTMDLSVEIQNHLLGRYADQKVNRREAPDQTYFTVTADASDRKRLDDLFMATDYGREYERYQSDARTQFGGVADKRP